MTLTTVLVFIHWSIGCGFEVIVIVVDLINVTAFVFLLLLTESKS